jgi:hypothetical protein
LKQILHQGDDDMEIQETDTIPEQPETSPEESQDNAEQDPPDPLHIEWAGYI